MQIHLDLWYIWITMTAEEVYEALVPVAEAERERLEAFRPDAAIWCYDKVINSKLEELGVRKDRALLCEVRDLAQSKGDRSGANWVISGTLNGFIAYMTPGFTEAKRYHDMYGS